MGKDERMIVHLPTLMLIVGYTVFWLELYVFKIPQGRTSPLAWIVWVILAVGSAWLARSGIKQFWNEGTVWYKQQDFFTKSWLTLAKSLSVFILAVVFLRIFFRRISSRRQMPLTIILRSPANILSSDHFNISPGPRLIFICFPLILPWLHFG